MPSVGVMRRYIGALYQLSRPDPVAAWVAGAFLLGASVAVYHAGLGGVHLADGAIAFGGAAIALAFGAHGLNDAYDWLTGTDQESIGKGTGGTRVIPEGKLSVLQTAAVGVVALAVTAGVGGYFYLKHGLPILVLTALAVGAPVAYSVPPIKLAYRPFPELLLVLPSLTGVTAGAELMLSGQVTAFGIAVGAIQALFNISWYMVSRLPDYEPDKAIGKVTTVVYLGREKAPLMGAAYLGAAVSVATAAAVAFTPVVLVTVPFALWSLKGLFDLDPYTPEQASHIRILQVRKAWAHAFTLAAGIAALGW